MNICSSTKLTTNHLTLIIIPLLIYFVPRSSLLATFLNQIPRLAWLVPLFFVLSGCANSQSNFDSEAQSLNNYELEYPVEATNHDSDHPQYTELLNKFRLWLIASAVPLDRMQDIVLSARQSIKQVSDLQSMSEVDQITELGIVEFVDVGMQLPEWYKPGGEIPEHFSKPANRFTDHSSENTIPSDFRIPSIHSALYLGGLYFKNRCDPGDFNGSSSSSSSSSPSNSSSPSDPNDPTSLSGQESQYERLTPAEYRHLHNFFLKEKIWTQHDYELAEATVELLDSQTLNGRTTCISNRIQ